MIKTIAQTTPQKTSNCIVCQTKLAPDIVDVGNQYPSAIYPLNRKEMEDLQSTSLNLTCCPNPDCALVQLSEVSDLQEVFARYPYESGSTATMRDILSDVAQESSRVSNLTENDIVLDIGGNDGTLLSFFPQAKIRVNIDAAHGVGSVLTGPQNIKVLSPFSASVYQNLDLPKPKLITSVAMFYHLDQPVEFCQEVTKVMDQDSIFCMQMTYLGSMYENNIYDNIVHEHRAYYSLHSLKQVFDRVGLHILGAKIVASYGGSIRVYASLRKDRDFDSSLTQMAQQIFNDEKKAEINSVGALVRFNDRLQILKATSLNLIQHLVQRDGPIAAFGASTKGNMICQFLGLTTSEISAVYDNSPRKIGSYLVGSGIPIRDEKELKGHLPRYTLILPYYYTDFFAKLLRSWTTKGSEHYLIRPLPVPTVLKLE